MIYLIYIVAKDIEKLQVTVPPSSYSTTLLLDFDLSILAGLWEMRSEALRRTAR